MDNILPDALSRWAYPASQTLADITKHGSVQDEMDMEALIEEEERDEKLCMVINLGKDFPPTLGGSEAPEKFFLGAPPTQGVRSAREKIQGLPPTGGPKRLKTFFWGPLVEGEGPT